MKIKTLGQVQNLKKGQTIYLVHGLGKSSYMTSVRIMSDKIQEIQLFSNLNALCLTVQKPYLKNPDEMFLHDIGVGVNYNNNRVFTKRKEALLYKQWCKKHTKTPVYSAMYDDYNDYSYNDYSC